MKIVCNDEVDIKLWELLLNKSKFSSPFQTPSFFELLKSIPIYSADVFAVQTGDSYTCLAVVAIQKESGLKSYFSRRGIVYGGPIINEATDKELSYLLEETKRRLKGKVIYIETRNFFDYSSHADSFINSKWIYEPYLNVRLNLEGYSKDKLISLIKYNRRREIRLSTQNGATYHLCTQEEEIYEVYKILHELYRKNVKKPLPPFDFFLKFYKSNILKVFIVTHKNKIIGGSFCPVLHNRGLYTYYYCGLRNYQRQIYPTHLAVFAALEYAIENNIPVVDFMGAGNPDIDYGVRQYKLEFGGELVEEGRYLKILNPFLYNIGKVGLKALKILS